ncbi:MAG: putative PEP-binding protein, partial [Planctomycetota bacterium]
MDIRKGIAVSPGIAVARPMVIDSKDYRIPRRSIMPSRCADEIRRVRNAFAGAIEELTALEAAQSIEESKIKDIFAVHLRFLRDKSFRRRITDFVQNELTTAEYAVSVILREIASHFAGIDDTYISERAADIYDIEKRLLTQLLGKVREDVEHLTEEVVIEAGGRTSHSAIVARSLGIPAVVALEEVTSIVTTESIVIIDGNRGVVVIDPDSETLSEYHQYADELSRLEHQLYTIKDKPAVTRDGVKITLLGNIEFQDEAEMVKEKGGEGIGLYRTEFLYLYNDSEPAEEDHYEAYAHAVRTFDKKPVVIRTMDMGADKYPQSGHHAVEPNPVLGLRSIRFCLQNLTMFKNQLR